MPKLIGILSIAWGLLWAVKPEFLRGRLLFKAHWYMFWTLLATIIYPLIHLYGKEIGVQGVLLTVAVFWAGMGILKKKLNDALRFVPLEAFRAAGVFHVVAGTALVWWPKH